MDKTNNSINIKELYNIFKEHKNIYFRLYNKADIKLYKDRKFHSNEELISEAMDSKCSAELIEKLWRFGRYFLAVD